MRTRICLYILLIAPLVVYWQTAFHEFGLHSDYSNLREAREDPGKLVRSAAAHGRPLYGAMLETSFAVTGEVEHLEWMRLCTVLLLTLLGVVMWRQLYQSGWNEIEAAGIGLGVVLLPSAQVLVGWAAGWPQALTLLLAMAGFSAIETEIERGGMKRVVALLGGCMIYTAAGLVYQANVLFALVIVTAVLLVRTGREPLSDLWWCVFHLVAIAAGLALSYFIIHTLFSTGVFQPAVDGANGPGALAFLRYPLPNALALFALNDDLNTGAVIYWGLILAVLVVLTLAFKKVSRSEDGLARRRSIYGLAALGVMTVAVCLVSSDRIDSYRVIFSLAALVMVLMTYALRVLFVAKKLNVRHYAGLAVIALVVGFLAHRNSYLLLAEPQANEWDLMRGAVLRASFTKQVRVHIITPSLAERSTDRSYADEFGSISSADGTTAQDMFKAALRARFPDKLPKGGSYKVTSGPTEPSSDQYDLLIDMRKLKTLR